MQLEILGARILVRRFEPPEQTQGGLYLLGREYPTIGQIEEIGKGARARKRPWRRIHLPEVISKSLDVGDFILFHREAVRQERVLDFLGRGFVLLDREHCLASYRGIKMKQFRPLGERILIKPIDPELKSGLIHLPQRAVERPAMGEVIAVGAGRYDDRNGGYISLDVQKGDKVFYGKFMGSEVKLDGEEYIIIQEGDIFGIIRS